MAAGINVGIPPSRSCSASSSRWAGQACFTSSHISSEAATEKHAW